ncbi:hypothetical protein ACFQGT_14950 [Natrialbaceae archaeon GCM10025810]|uniref:DUF7553 family protein n=1 Tax=Halovalidus salilacus TaxID=3075124 RepID=UPI0036139800
MNKHFHDSVYYLKRASQHARLGLEEAAEPVVVRVRRRFGREPEPEAESPRVEAVLEDVKDLEARAENEARERLGRVRRRFGGRSSS